MTKKETNYSNTLSNCMKWSCTFLKLFCVAWTRECWSLGMRFVKIYGILLSHTAYGVIYWLNITNVQCSLECYIVTARNISKKESVDLIIILLCKNPKILMTNPLNVLNVSLRKQATFCDATTGFPANWHLRNKRRNFILMTHHYPDLGSASNILVVLCHLWNLLQPIGSTTQILHHQFTGKPLVVLRNVVSFLRLIKCWVVTAYNVLCCGVLYVWKWSTVANLYPPEVSL